MQKEVNDEQKNNCRKLRRKEGRKEGRKGRKEIERENSR